MINIADLPSVHELITKVTAAQREPDAIQDTVNLVAEPSQPEPGYPAKSLSLVDGRYRAVDKK